MNGDTVILSFQYDDWTFYSPVPNEDLTWGWFINHDFGLFQSTDRARKQAYQEYIKRWDDWSTKDFQDAAEDHSWAKINLQVTLEAYATNHGF